MTHPSLADTRSRPRAAQCFQATQPRYLPACPSVANLPDLIGYLQRHPQALEDSRLTGSTHLAIKKGSTAGILVYPAASELRMPRLTELLQRCVRGCTMAVLLTCGMLIASPPQGRSQISVLVESIL
jgi:hypothetical protein